MFVRFSVGTYSTTTKKSAISDTGSSYILAPNEDFQKILNQTGAFFDFLHMIYVVPCSKVGSFPDRRVDKFSWLLGDVFSRAFCTIYDVGGKRIGFARARHWLMHLKPRLSSSNKLLHQQEVWKDAH
ncbi:Peptidase A1 domain-containing protein [Aphelenchoides fujianensis]|nr:Peptidase A1 domain-containing protein [Aphelenchoides fujianensis]